MGAFHWVLQRRAKQAVWLYVVCLIVYVLYALMYAGELSFHAGATPRQLWLLAFPAVIVILQLTYPTVLGWTVVLLGFVFYAVLGMYYLIRNASWQPAADTSGFVLGSLTVMGLIGICVSLVRHRPFRPDAGAESS